MHTMQLSSVDTNLLVILHPLLQTRSVVKASKQLGMSASATSHALARLRLLLEDELLVRAGRGLVLTPRGAQLEPLVASAVASLEEIIRPAEGFDPGKLQRTFHLGYADYLDWVLLPSLDRTLREQAPELNVLTNSSFKDSVAELRDGTLDFAFVLSGDLPPDMHTRPVFTDHFVSIVRKKHPCLDKRMTLRRFAAMQHLLIAPQGRSGGVVDTMLLAKGLKRRVARTVSSFMPAPFIVANSDYVLTLPGSVARVAATFVDFELLDMPESPPGYTLLLVWHERMHRDPAHRWFRRLIAQELACIQQSPKEK